MMKKIAVLLGVLSLICSLAACTPESPPVEDLTKGDRFNVDYTGVEADDEIVSFLKQYISFDDLGPRTKTCLSVLTSKEVSFEACMTYIPSEYNSLLNSSTLSDGEKKVDNATSDKKHMIDISYDHKEDKYNFNVISKVEDEEDFNIGVVNDNSIIYVLNNKNKVRMQYDINNLNNENSEASQESSTGVDLLDGYTENISKYTEMFKNNKLEFKYIGSKDDTYKGKLYYSEEYNVEAIGVADKDKTVSIKVFFYKAVPVGVTVKYNDKELNIDILKLDISTDNVFTIPDYDEKGPLELFVSLIGTLNM